jgi:hypothetical protein
MGAGRFAPQTLTNFNTRLNLNQVMQTANRNNAQDIMRWVDMAVNTNTKNREMAATEDWRNRQEAADWGKVGLGERRLDRAERVDTERWDVQDKRDVARQKQQDRQLTVAERNAATAEKRAEDMGMALANKTDPGTVSEANTLRRAGASENAISSWMDGDSTLVDQERKAGKIKAAQLGGMGTRGRTGDGGGGGLDPAKDASYWLNLGQTVGHDTSFMMDSKAKKGLSALSEKGQAFFTALRQQIPLYDGPDPNENAANAFDASYASVAPGEYMQSVAKREGLVTNPKGLKPNDAMYPQSAGKQFVGLMKQYVGLSREDASVMAMRDYLLSQKGGKDTYAGMGDFRKKVARIMKVNAQREAKQEAQGAGADGTRRKPTGTDMSPGRQLKLNQWSDPHSAGYEAPPTSWNPAPSAQPAQSDRPPLDDAQIAEQQRRMDAENAAWQAGQGGVAGASGGPGGAEVAGNWMKDYARDMAAGGAFLSDAFSGMGVARPVGSWLMRQAAPYGEQLRKDLEPFGKLLWQ